MGEPTSAWKSSGRERKEGGRSGSAGNRISCLSSAPCATLIHPRTRRRRALQFAPFCCGEASGKVNSRWGNEPQAQPRPSDTRLLRSCPSSPEACRGAREGKGWAGRSHLRPLGSAVCWAPTRVHRRAGGSSSAWRLALRTARQAAAKHSIAGRHAALRNPLPHNALASRLHRRYSPTSTCSPSRTITYAQPCGRHTQPYLTVIQA